MASEALVHASDLVHTWSNVISVIAAIFSLHTDHAVHSCRGVLYDLHWGNQFQKVCLYFKGKSMQAYLSPDMARVACPCSDYACI